MKHPMKVEVVDGWHVASVTYGPGAGEFFLARGRTKEEAIAGLRRRLEDFVEAGRIARDLLNELFVALPR